MFREVASPEFIAAQIEALNGLYENYSTGIETTEVCTKSPGGQDSYAKISDNAPPEELPEQCA